jgi:hypothetical protein
LRSGKSNTNANASSNCDPNRHADGKRKTYADSAAAP